MPGIDHYGCTRCRPFYRCPILATVPIRGIGRYRHPVSTTTYIQYRPLPIAGSGERQRLYKMISTQISTPDYARYRSLKPSAVTDTPGNHGYRHPALNTSSIPDIDHYIFPIHGTGHYRYPSIDDHRYPVPAITDTWHPPATIPAIVQDPIDPSIYSCTQHIGHYRYPIAVTTHRPTVSAPLYY